MYISGRQRKNVGLGVSTLWIMKSIIFWYVVPVVKQKFIDILEKHTASIFRVEK
jgi:hypothetical protein